MRNIKLWIYSIVLVLLVISCVNKDVVEPQQTRQIRLTAHFDEELLTRVSLQENGALGFITKWKESDNVHIFVEQNNKLEDLGLCGISNISADGKSCAINVTLPANINAENSYNLYGFCGKTAKLQNGKIIVDGALVRTPLNALQVPVWFTITGGPQSLSVNFKHLGAYEMTHFINKTSKTISIAHRGYKTTNEWTSATKSIKLDDKVEVDVSHPQTGLSGVVSVPAGSSAIITSWYMPTGKKMNGATLLATINGKEVQSTNTKTSNVDIESGKAYHLYATWNDKQLAFGNEEINVEKLSLSQASVQLKVNESASIYVLGGSGSYTLQNSKPTVAKATLEGTNMQIKALTKGSATITVIDNTTKEKVTLTVNITAGEDDDNPLTSRTGNPIFDKLIANMVYVGGGTFDMGATPEQELFAEDNERPVHKVTLSSFYICKYEVTQDLWEEVMGENPSRTKGSNLPLENVSWKDCRAFIKTLNAKTGMNFRMPTEAEWEYAARGGRKTYYNKYAGGVKIDKLAWYVENSERKTHEVGLLAPNELGLYDMSGNVWEWCQDFYGNYSAENQNNPTGLTDGSYNVARGGSCSHEANFCRVSFRGFCVEGDKRGDIGLRLALSLTH